MTLGGQGTHGHILTPKVKEKISLKVKQAQNKLKQEDPEKYYK